MAWKLKLKSKVALIWAGALCVVVVGLCACAPVQNKGIPVPEATKVEVTPEADEYGVVHADSWSEIYPNQYSSYKENETNSREAAPDGTEKLDYLETQPEIKVLGLGYGYSKYYTEPASHLYTLDTIKENGRVGEKTTAGCITCKTPQFTALANQVGEGIYAESMWDYVDGFDEPISCYNCHENDPSTLKVTQQNWIKAMGDDADSVPLESQVCGQCHNDYSMDPVTKVPTNPYGDGVDSMNPDDALKWYDDHDFVDWTYESTGAKMIAVRHAEFEFNYGSGGNHMTDLGYTCADCHMGAEFGEDGTAYTDHNWTSPTENAELIESDCSKCHADLNAEVDAWQEEYTTYTHQTGLRLADYVHNFEHAIEEGTIDDDQKARLQYIQRAACYYWNFVAAENSEGAHNIELVRETLDKAQALVDEGDAIVGVASTVKEIS